MDKAIVTSSEKYLQVLKKSGLLSSEELAPHLAALADATGALPVDARVVAKRLLDEGLLTTWQNWHLLEGRHRGFYLGKYKLLSYVNSGGMSRVYLAEHSLLRRQVALKLFSEQSDRDEFRLRRFYQECEACAALNHKNIVRAYDFDHEGKFHFLVMEYVDGTDLQRYVQRLGHLNYETAADYIRQAADGLHHAHSRGMIHRDIKPANLLVDRDGVVKILDFGVVRRLDNDETSLTLEQGVHIIGTVDYLPPEQFLDGHNVSQKADLYSLGCTLYYLLTGHAPFNYGNQSQRIMMHQTELPPSIQIDRPDAPRGLVSICERLMAKHPDDRYSSAAEASDLLAEWRMHYLAGDEQWIPEPPLTNLRIAPDTIYGDVETEKRIHLSSLLIDPDPTPGPTDWNDAPALRLRLQRVVEQLLTAARSRRDLQLTTLLDSFVLPEPSAWFTHVCGSDQGKTAAQTYEEELPQLKGNFLRLLLDMGQRAEIRVEVETATQVTVHETERRAAGRRLAIPLFQVRFISDTNQASTISIGPFAYVREAFRLLTPLPMAA